MSALPVPALPSAAAATPLADTGQTHRHTRSLDEDGDYAGRAPAFADNGDGTVTDKVTGLVWENVDGAPTSRPDL